MNARRVRQPREIPAGTSFGPWTVICEVERANDKIRNRRFLCLCTECGEEKVKYLSNLTQGKGCMCSVDFAALREKSRQTIIARRRTEGMVDDHGRKCGQCNTWKPWDEFREAGQYRRNPMGKSAKCRECCRERRTARLYGLTWDELQWLLDRQENRCALCGEPGSLERGNSLSIDHDHSCCGPDRGCKKCVRGLLCDVCNRRLLGIAERRPLLRIRFADYLDQRPFGQAA